MGLEDIRLMIKAIGKGNYDIDCFKTGTQTQNVKRLEVRDKVVPHPGIVSCVF